MKIVKLSVENIKKLKVVEITPNGNVVEVTGPNGSGKSSVLDAIFYALTRQDNVPTHVIRQGEDKATIRLDLGELVVTRRFTAAGGTSLIVEAANGARFPSPQRMLDDLIGSLSFDPLAFTRLKPKEQLEALRKVVKLDVSAIDGARQRHFDERAITHRRIKEIETYLQVPPPPDSTPDNPIDVMALVQKLQDTNEANTNLERARRQRDDDEQAIEGLLFQAKEKRLKASQLITEAEILERTAASSREAINALAPLPQNEDTTAIVQQIDGARTINANVDKKKARLKLEGDLRLQLKKAEWHSATIAGYDTKRQEAIAAVKMPVEGMSFGEGEVLMNGLPLTNASSAEQLRVSVALAMAANPKLRVLRVKDGSLLDEASLKLLTEMAATADYQVWVERVEDSHGRPCVVMEDGAIRGV